MSEVMLELTVDGKTVKAPIKNIETHQKTENTGEVITERVYKIESGQLYNVDEQKMIEL
jgi:hypothetical protein